MDADVDADAGGIAIALLHLSAGALKITLPWRYIYALIITACSLLPNVKYHNNIMPLLLNVKIYQNGQNADINYDNAKHPQAHLQLSDLDLENSYPFIMGAICAKIWTKYTQRFCSTTESVFVHKVFPYLSIVTLTSKIKRFILCGNYVFQAWWRYTKRIFHRVMVRIEKVEPEGIPVKSGLSFREVQITGLPEGSTFFIVTNDPEIDYFSCLSL